jgi:phage recombination protein Bet
MPSNALALAPDEFGFTPTQFELIHGMLASSAPKDAGLTTQELGLFLTQCQRTGLDPLARQIYAIWRWDNVLRRPKMAIQVGIDGQRLVAERTGHYQGQDGPYWCGPDGQWVDVWLAETPPAAAKVGVYKQGHTQATYGVALYREYVQTNREGKPTPLWASMPTTMLAKCAESQALRKAFPQELSGLYTTEEMSQADTERQIIDVVPTDVPTDSKVAESKTQALPAGDQAVPRTVDASPEAASRAPMTAPRRAGTTASRPKMNGLSGTTRCASRRATATATCAPCWGARHPTTCGR